MSQTTIQTYREIGLVCLDKNGCNTNFFSVAHAHDNSIPIVSRVIFLSYLFYITFLTYNFLSQRQYEFVTKLEAILENNQQLSLAAVVNFMVNTVDFYMNRHFSTYDVVDLFIKVGKEHSQFPETYNSFHYETFIVILKLNPESSFKEIWEQFDKVVSSHPSSPNLGALREVCWLCENENVEDMELFDISNFNLDKDSSEALKELLQYCIDKKTSGGLDQSEAHQFNSNYDFNLDSGHSDSIWH